MRLELESPVLPKNGGGEGEMWVLEVKGILVFTVKN